MKDTVFSRCLQRGHEHISFFYCPVTGLKAIVAIHSTVLGPSLGGCRMKLYEHEEEALEDVMRLAEGMTYKNSVAGMNLGGGKACIIANKDMEEGRTELFTQFGKYLNSLDGTYYTAEDMGTRVSDMEAIKAQTNYVVGFDENSGGSGDPSPWTARGVYFSIKAVSEEKLGKPLKDLSVAIQGIGKVGGSLAERLHEDGAKLYVTDTTESACREAEEKYGATACTLDEIYSVDCDIFSPCAIGQTVNPDTIKELKCKAILGAANNQLSDDKAYQALKEKNIIYCPDFVVNAGGVISVGAELNPGGWKDEWVSNKIAEIPNTIIKVLDRAEKRDQFPETTALNMAHERIEAAREA